jgi:hypothetical protein
MLLTGLHALAASRGDGLRPELLALLKQREAIQASGVSDIAGFREGAFRQAGPNPVRSVSGPLPDGVLSFLRKPALPSHDARTRRAVNDER